MLIAIGGSAALGRMRQVIALLIWLIAAAAIAKNSHLLG
jgi:hypothetical protein